jgi:hypothetical protein
MARFNLDDLLYLRSVDVAVTQATSLNISVLNENFQSRV